MEETLHGLAAGSIVPRPQNHAEASLAPILKKEDGRIDWNRPAQEIFNRMRGFAPWPGAYTTFRGQTCHVWGAPMTKADLTVQFPDRTGGRAGTLLTEKNGLFVVCGAQTHLRVQFVKLEGRKQIAAAEFTIGARLKPGERFGDTSFARI